jgi:hypothetical protein
MQAYQSTPNKGTGAKLEELTLKLESLACLQ